MKKAELIAKVAKEQNLDPKTLERLNMKELEKMDKVVPDDGDLLGGDSSEAPQSDSTVPGSSDDSPTPMGNVDGGTDNSDSGTPDAAGPQTSGGAPERTPVFIGYHPVTGVEVYQ